MSSPFVEFPDFKDLTDRQLLSLALYEIIELKAEVRALTDLVLSDKTSVSSEQFDKIVDSAQDAAIRETVEHARQIAKGSQRPGTN